MWSSPPAEGERASPRRQPSRLATGVARRLNSSAIRVGKGETSWPKVKCAATRRRRSRRRSTTRRRRAVPRSRRSPWGRGRPSPGRTRSARRGRNLRRPAGAPLFRGDDPSGGGMMRIGLPGRPIIVVGLVAPRDPALARAAREQLEERAGAACLDDLVLLVRLARMLALARCQQVELPPSRRERARAPAAHPEKNELGHVAEIEADAP